MRRLIWGFAGRTYHIVGNLMSRLNLYFQNIWKTAMNQSGSCNQLWLRFDILNRSRYSKSECKIVNTVLPFSFNLFCVLKKVSLRWLFWVPTTYTLFVKNKKVNFQLHSLIWRLEAFLSQLYHLSTQTCLENGTLKLLKWILFKPKMLF